MRHIRGNGHSRGITMALYSCAFFQLVGICIFFLPLTWNLFHCAVARKSISALVQVEKNRRFFVRSLNSTNLCTCEERFYAFLSTPSRFHISWSRWSHHEHYTLDWFSPKQIVHGIGVNFKHFELRQNVCSLGSIDAFCTCVCVPESFEDHWFSQFARCFCRSVHSNVDHSSVRTFWSNTVR